MEIAAMDEHQTNRRTRRSADNYVDNLVDWVHGWVAFFISYLSLIISIGNSTDDVSNNGMKTSQRQRTTESVVFCGALVFFVMLSMF